MTPDSTRYTATDRDRHVERLDDETLVYDTATDHVLRLAPDAAGVWHACADGATASAIADQTGLGAGRVDQALAELVANDLLEVSDATGLTRRSFTAKAGLGVAALAGAGLVTSMVAPTAASAASDDGGGSGGNNRPAP